MSTVHAAGRGVGGHAHAIHGALPCADCGRSRGDGLRLRTADDIAGHERRLGLDFGSAERPAHERERTHQRQLDGDSGVVAAEECLTTTFGWRFIVQ